MIVPPTRYQRVFERLQAAPSDRGSRYTVLRFYAYRCSKDFLEKYVSVDSKLLDRLAHPGSYLSAVAGPELVGRLHSLGLLPETIRTRFVDRWSGSPLQLLTRTFSATISFDKFSGLTR